MSWTSRVPPPAAATRSSRSGWTRTRFRSPRTHEDQYLEIKYIDVSGATQSYSGWEKGFDWSNVKKILYAKRDGKLFTPPDENVARKEQTTTEYLLDLVASDLDSGQLKDKLIAAAPSPTAVLVAASQRTPNMNSSDLKAALLESGPTGKNPPLEDPALVAAIDSGALSSSDLKAVLIDNSPLSADVLAAMFDRTPAMNTGDLNGVLSEQ